MNTEVLPKITSAQEDVKIRDFLESSLERLNRVGAVIGLSGGLDSSTCAYLLRRVLEKDKILALIMPERDSDPVNIEHARLVAKNLDLRIIEIDLTEILEKIGIYKLVSTKEASNSAGLEKLIKNLTKLTRSSSLFSTGISLAYGMKEGHLKRLAARLLFTNLFSSFEDKFSESTKTLLPLEVTSTLSFERKKLDKDSLSSSN